MKNLPSLKTANLPSLNSAYGALDIVGNTFGRYFDYKRDTEMIEHETEKVKQHAKVVVKKIGAELTKSLDVNEKSFKKEMKRLETIAKDLKGSRKSKSKIMKTITQYTKMLSDENVPSEVKLQIPELIKQAYMAMETENGGAIQRLNLMSNFEPNTKLIGGE